MNGRPRVDLDQLQVPPAHKAREMFQTHHRSESVPALLQGHAGL
jgi:hypothetical protein